MIELEFPKPSGRRGEWFPLHWEPIPGSGERITIGVAARLADVWHVRQTLDSDVMRCLHGNSAPVRIIEDVLAALRADPAGWTPHLTGFHRGASRWAQAESMRDLLQNAIEDASFLTRRSAGAEEDEAIEDNMENSDEWTRQIKHGVLDLRPDFASRFGQRFEFKAGARPTRLDYVAPAVIANFVRVLPGRRLGYSVERAKIKLADLSQARTHVSDGLFEDAPAAFELLVYRPPENTVEYGDAALHELRRALVSIEDFADKHALRMESFSDAGHAAKRLIQAAA